MYFVWSFHGSARRPLVNMMVSYKNYTMLQRHPWVSEITKQLHRFFIFLCLLKWQLKL